MFKLFKKNESKEMVNLESKIKAESDVKTQSNKEFKTYESINNLLMDLVNNTDINKLEEDIESGNLQEAWSSIATQLNEIIKFNSSRAKIVDGVMYFELKIGDFYEASVHSHIVNMLNSNFKSAKVKFITGYPRADNVQISVQIQDGSYIGYENIYLKREKSDDEKYKLYIYADCEYDDQLVDFLEKEVPSIIYGDVNKICYVDSVEVLNEKIDRMLNMEEYTNSIEGEFITLDRLLGRFMVGNLNLADSSIVPNGTQFRFKSFKYLLSLLEDYDLREDFRGVNYVTLVVDPLDKGMDGGTVDQKMEQLYPMVASEIGRAIGDKFYYEMEAFDLNKVIEFVKANADLNIKIYDNMEREYLN